MDHLFNVHPGNGSVFLLKSLDREESAWHNISVIATELRKSRGGQGYLQKWLQKNVYSGNEGNVQNYRQEKYFNGYFCLRRSHFSLASGKFHLFQPRVKPRLYSTAQMKITFWFEWNPSFIFHKPTPPRFADKTLHVLLKWLNNVSFYDAPPTAPWRMKENHLSFLLIIFFSTASYVLNLCREELDLLNVWNWLYFLQRSDVFLRK